MHQCICISDFFLFFCVCTFHHCAFALRYYSTEWSKTFANGHDMQLQLKCIYEIRYAVFFYDDFASHCKQGANVLLTQTYAFILLLPHCRRASLLLLRCISSCVCAAQHDTTQSACCCACISSCVCAAQHDTTHSACCCVCICVVESVVGRK